MKLLNGKTAIVTDSTSGIGLGIAWALAGAGCDTMLNGFGEAPAIERERAQIATSGITCNAICPGWVLTPLIEKKIKERASREHISVDQAKADLLSEKQSSHEFATPAQLGALTVFLYSEAADQIRGAALPVDGGWTAQ